jgi:cytochrome c oxidase subunit 2
MDAADYQTWLSGGAPEGSLASAGEKLFADLACNTCHRPDSRGRGPVLAGVFGHAVQLQSGETVNADEQYLRESILQPSAKVTAGYQPVMPAFQGIVTEEQLLALIEYVKSLSTPLQQSLPARPDSPTPRPGEASRSEGTPITGGQAR